MYRQHIVLALLINNQNQIALAQRDFPDHLGGNWELPGGKVENNEPAQAALKRELYEELGITITQATPWRSFEHDYSDRLLTLDVWHVTNYEGEVCGNEGQHIAWVPIEQLQSLDLPAANQPLVRGIIEVWGQSVKL